MIDPIKEQIEIRAENMKHIRFPAVFEKFLLENGESFDAQELPLGHKKAEAKECFQNATQLALQMKELRYVEGYAYRPELGVLIHHAWCINNNDKVVDVTWDRPEECFYYGVVLNDMDLLDRITETGVYGVFDLGMGIDLEYMKAKFGFEIDLKEYSL